MSIPGTRLADAPAIHCNIPAASEYDIHHYSE
ncbi:hypothetical protein PANA5342_1102 [Pantoea ananatis LMG 5342]|nr:hypothetical protein PANA5342_1102 [Pantoea ananatis LMG 5342]